MHDYRRETAPNMEKRQRDGGELEKRILSMKGVKRRVVTKCSTGGRRKSSGEKLECQGLGKQGKVKNSISVVEKSDMELERRKWGGGGLEIGKISPSATKVILQWGGRRKT